MALSRIELAERRVERPERNQSFQFYSSMSAWFYILRLKPGALYVGATTDLHQRFKDHCSGKACRTTSLDPPVAIVYTEEVENFSDARRREARSPFSRRFRNLAPPRQAPKILTVLPSLFRYVPAASVVLLVMVVLPVLQVAVPADLLPSEPMERGRNSSSLDHNPRTVVVRRRIPETFVP
jgi:predicted GIY-YIG superfamily endonuclease